MDQITTGLSEGDFTSLRVLDANGVMTNILVLLQNAGGVGEDNKGKEEATSRVKIGRIQILQLESCSQIPLVSFSIIA